MLFQEFDSSQKETNKSKEVSSGAMPKRLMQLDPNVLEVKKSDGENEYKIIFEEQEVGTRIKIIENFEDAFALYFIFNVKNPKKKNYWHFKFCANVFLENGP